MRSTVYIGQNPQNPLFHFTDDEVVSISTDMSVSMDLSEIAADVAEICVKSSDLDLADIPWATPVYIYTDNELNAKLYLTSIARTASNQFMIVAESAIGLMEYDTYYGDFLTGESFKAVAKKILLTNGFTWGNYATKLHRGMLGDMTYDGVQAANFHGIQTREYLGEYLVIEADFKLNKCILNDLPNDPYQNATSVKLALWGTIASDELLSKSSANANTLKKATCGLYMLMRRSSTSAAWPDYGEVFFEFGNVRTSLGTQTAPKNYVFTINVPNRVAVINGASYSLTFSYAAADSWAYTREFAYGGGRQKDLEGTDTLKYYDRPVYCDIEYGLQHSYQYMPDQPEGSYGTYDTQIIIKEKINGEIHITNTFDWRISEEYFGWAVCSGQITTLQRKPQEYQKEIANGANYDAVTDVKVYGWIPICTKREALHQLLFSTGVTLIKDSNGNYLFTGLSNTESQIADAFIYEGGSVEKFENVNSLEITEHSFVYTETAEKEVLYENDALPSADAVTAQYSHSPVYTGSAPEVDDSITLHDYNCNACIISGRGQVKQIPYSHNTGVVIRIIGNYADGKTVAVENCGLVTLQNSEMILDRVEEYYRDSTTAKFDIVSHGEKCGARFSYKNPFKELSSGILARATHQYSGIDKVSCEFIEGFRPLPPGGGYRNFVILTGSGSWAVPASVYEEPRPRIRVVLIGGGSGGWSGLAGPNGLVTPVGGGSNHQFGGLGGEAGDGGKVLDITLRNIQPGLSVTYSCGTGGAGGARCTSTSSANRGSEGTPTTASIDGISYSSEYGRVLETGYINLLSGKVYAKPWETLNWNADPVGIVALTPFQTFGQGSNGGYVYSVPAILGGGYIYGPSGIAFGMMIEGYYDRADGGARGANANYNGALVATGGGGGGPAIGGTAANGSNAYISGNVAHAGNGGKGADAVATPPKATSYDAEYFGYGGHGGYGGGAGGNSGGVNTGGATGTGGAGGYGGAGGTGGDGCVIIYY